MTTGNEEYSVSEGEARELMGRLLAGDATLTQAERDFCASRLERQLDEGKKRKKEEFQARWAEMSEEDRRELRAGVRRTRVMALVILGGPLIVLALLIFLLFS